MDPAPALAASAAPSAATRMLKPSVAVSVPSVAEYVYAEAAPATVGVPAIVRDDASKDSPAGSAGDSE